MITTQQQEWLITVYRAAIEAKHVWPAMAAAEACLESEWGQSELCFSSRNLFGLKRPSTWTGATISIATREFLRGKWVMVPATWPVFSSYTQCMTERMNVLRSNPCYAPALKASTAEEYIQLVSKVWATDPLRGQKALEIYRAHPAMLTT